MFVVCNIHSCIFVLCSCLYCFVFAINFLFSSLPQETLSPASTARPPRAIEFTNASERARPFERPDDGRFGFSRDCLVVAGSGDNCNSLAGMGVIAAGGSDGDTGTRGGDVMVSLGTSDTLLGVTVDPSPTTTGGFECLS